jgi:outer membrane receptor for ferric coprogen and ferric-rhodotorulic acid
MINFDRPANGDARRARVRPALAGAFALMTSISSSFAQDASPHETELPAVTVRDSTLSATTENTKSYTTGSMSAATGLPLSIRETPQSVTVITRQQMEDKGIATISDAARHAPGLTISHAQGGPLRDRFYSRGFAVDNITYDGLPATLGQYGGDMLVSNMALYDRVEIVRGAAGLTQGAGNPAAAINLVRKRPTRDIRFRANANLGNWDRYGMEADVSGALNSPGTLRGRAVAAVQDNKSFQDYASNKRQVFYLIGEADLGSRTLLTVSASRQQDDNRITWGGLPVAADGSDLRLPRSTWLGNTWEFWNRGNDAFYAGLEHRFDNAWKVSFAANRVQTKSDMAATYISQSGGIYADNPGEYHYTDKRASYDLHATGPFHAFGRKHELAFGAAHRNGDFDGYGGWSSAITIGTASSLGNWNPSLNPRPVINLNLWKMVNNEKQKAFYATTRLNLSDSAKLILGARVDDYAFTDKVSRAGYEVNGNLTKYAGVIYDLDSRHSAYVSYTDIFKPQNYYDISGKLIEPVVGKNYEAGLKGEYFNGALNASIALFRIDQENLGMQLSDQTVCPSFPSIRCYQAAGLVRSEGIDVEIQGALTPKWQVMAGYTFVDKRYRKDANPANEGHRADTQLPRHLFKLSTMYQLPGGWRVGGSVYWQNEIYRYGAGFYSRQDSYAIVDLSAGYRFDKHLDIQLNVNNLFDETYYQSISTSGAMGGNVYGMPRNAMLMARYRY